MTFQINTHLKAEFGKVITTFDQNLFIYLSPAFPSIRVITFEGCSQGDKISLQLDFWLFKSTWDGIITETSATPDKWFFIDQGIRLPFPLKKWQHKHLVTKINHQEVILSDIIDYSTGTLFMDIIAFPFLYLMFFARRPKYRKYFSS